MNEHSSYGQMDPLLQPFLHTSSDMEARQYLEQLMAQAAPGIARITRSSSSPEDAFQEATHRVLRQLQELRVQVNENGISNYLHYVKVVASRVVKGEVREEHPKHRSLVDSLRHALRREPSLALWDSEGRHKLCGLVEWRDQNAGRTRSERLTLLLDNPRVFEDVIAKDCVVRMKHVELLRQLFAWIGHPIRFDELTRIVCGLKQIEEVKPVADCEDVRGGFSEWLPDKRRRPDEQAEWKDFLSRLWTQIEQLPPLQRLAYLLNFTAADGQVELFWAYGVASIRRIGATLQITDDQFARVWPILDMSAELRKRAEECVNYDEKFAILWQHLPLTDAAIASLLGTERQKVINLRKAAGDRLSRNMTRPNFS